VRQVLRQRLGVLFLKKIYMAGVYLSEKHIQDAWARIKTGVRVDHAVSSVIPSSKRINSINRAVYQTNLIALLNLKSHLFAMALEEVRKGGDWHRIFRGRSRILWPSMLERGELGFGDFTSHEVVLTEPGKRRRLKVRMMIDHSKRSIKEAVLVDFDGKAN
jgi:hypothetical protein